MRSTRDQILFYVFTAFAPLTHRSSHYRCYHQPSWKMLKNGYFQRKNAEESHLCMILSSSFRNRCLKYQNFLIFETTITQRLRERWRTMAGTCWRFHCTIATIVTVKWMLNMIIVAIVNFSCNENQALRPTRSIFRYFEL